LKFKIETEFQETEIGKIPKNWKVVRLKEIALEIKSGFASGKRDDVNGVVHLRMFNIGLDGILTFDEVVKVPKPEDWKQYLLEYGDILLVNTSGSEEHIGKVAFFEKSDMKCTYSNHLTRIRINRSLTDPKWIYFVLYYLWYKGYFRTFIHQQAGGQRNIPLKTIENIPVILPPYNEVKSLVKILTSLQFTSKKVNEAINKLTALKKALMRELLTGRIRVNEENGKLVFHRETEFQETKIGKISKDWKVVKLEELAVEMYYGLTAKAVDQPTGLRMLRTTDIKDYKVDWNSLPYCEITDTRSYNLQKYLLRKNDLIVSRAGTAGLSVLVERDFENVIFGSYLIKVRLSETQAYPKYVHYFMQSELYWDQVLPKQAGSTLKNISLPILRNIIVPLPPINEQKEIAKIISLVDRVIELQHEERARLDHLKRGLMDLLLTGRVRVLE
jgi:type I restriction enzyme S subunit